METSIKKIIHKISGKDTTKTEDLIAVEKRLKISINNNYILSVYCTPAMIRELVVGMLANEGIIKGGWCAERMNIEYNEDISADIQSETNPEIEGEKALTSGCMGGMTFIKKMITEKLEDDFSISPDDLLSIFGDFQNRSQLYRLTGCIHSAALSDGKKIIAFAEDIGRHNAVDKVIGYCLLEGIKFNAKIMLASGRLSSEITSKCSRWGIPIIASRTAPTNLALEIAEARGMTLAGFVRGNRFNIYTHHHRIAG
jgi:FdhD protein